MVIARPAQPLWGKETEHALENFQISGRALPIEVVHALAYEPEEFPNLPPECDRRVPRHAEAPIS